MKEFMKKNKIIKIIVAFVVLVASYFIIGLFLLVIGVCPKSISGSLYPHSVSDFTVKVIKIGSKALVCPVTPVVRYGIQ